MKILQISRVFVPSKFGGIKAHVYNISKELVKRGHEVTVYTSNAYDQKTNLDRKGIYDVDGINVVYFNNYFPKSYFFTPGIIKSIKNELKNYDIIHMHDTKTFQNLVTYYYCRKNKVPYVLSAHGTLPHIIEKILLKKIYDGLIGYKILKNASKLIAVSPVEVERYKRIGIKEDKIVEIPNGIDASKFRALPKKGFFKEKYNIEEENIVLSMGRIHKRKRLDILINAFAELIEKREDIRLVIAGPDGGYLSELKNLIDKLSIKDKITFTGFISSEDKLGAYVDADLFVLPAEKEVFGIVIAEAAICETPVIVTEECEISDAIQKENFGLVVEYGSTQQLKEAMELLLNDKNLSRKLGKNGKKFVLSNWTWEKIVPQLERVYEGVVS